MTKAKTPFNYPYDRSAYIVLNSGVRRCPDTGRLMVIEKNNKCVT